jgi:hypothetical protein
MRDNGREQTATDEGAVPEAKPTCTALVPLTSPARWSQGLRRRWSPDPKFLTHLIATAEHAPQTRSLRRASFADAKTAYRAGQSSLRSAGRRTQQII